MKSKKTLSKNVRRSRNGICKRLKKLRKARDIASNDAVITKRKKEVWKLKDIPEHYHRQIYYLFLGDLAKEIYDGNGVWLHKAPAPPSRPVRAKK
ncbi:hypothetical protein ACQKII_09490 [Lysinibacillus sp. NPDC048646]|uniref:hypothetical protein n=1 Tax=Lysinibacillus sp. NPDC048646 TaxID=3390574 RepID=UPI003D0461C9